VTLLSSREFSKEVRVAEEYELHSSVLKWVLSFRSPQNGQFLLGLLSGLTGIGAGPEGEKGL